MPQPKGWSKAETARRDRCVADLKAKGKPESNAYAICTASIGASRGKKK